MPKRPPKQGYPHCTNWKAFAVFVALLFLVGLAAKFFCGPPTDASGPQPENGPTVSNPDSDVVTDSSRSSVGCDIIALKVTQVMGNGRLGTTCWIHPPYTKFQAAGTQGPLAVVRYEDCKMCYREARDRVPDGLNPCPKKGTFAIKLSRLKALPELEKSDICREPLDDLIKQLSKTP